MAEAKMNRRNESLLQPLEFPALQWLAARMPAWVMPDTLTIIGFLGAILACAAYAKSASNIDMIWLASLGLLINWFGDSLDGTLARFRKIERPRYGFFLDHTTDVFVQILIATGLGLSGFIRMEIALFGLIVYLLLSVLTFLRAQLLKTLQISYVGFGPTEMRCSLIAMNTAIWFFPPQPIRVSGIPLLYSDLISLSWSVFGGTTLIYLVSRTLRELKADSQRTGTPLPPST